MFRNYLKVALRNIGRHKGYAFINIAGLAVGIACCLLILLWVRDELSFDRFNENTDDIYRVLQDIRFSDHETTWAITQGPLGPSLENDIPEILRTVRITWRGMQLRTGEIRFDETVGMADGSIFVMFTFPLIAGDTASALSDPRSIVLSEEMARKYFQGEDPLGKVIHADGKFDLRVTGIMSNIPRNSHLQFDFLVPFVFGRELGYTVDRWDNSSFRTYVQLRPGVAATEVIAKISSHLEDKPTIEKDAKLTLQPLKRIYLHSNYEFDMALGDIRYVRLFSLVAFLILLIACINFMNLSTARSLNRAREVGMRKVSGANRGHIVRQFYGESALLTGIALASGFVLTAVLLSPFNNLAAKELSLSVLGDPRNLLGLAAVAGLTGIIAGSYPALFLSSFEPVRVLKGSPASGSKGAAFRKILVVVQFALSVMLIISTIFIHRQLRFMREYKLGYNKEHLMTMRLRGDIGEKFEAFKAELLRIPDVSGVTACSDIPTNGFMFSNSLWKWEGQGPDDTIIFGVPGEGLKQISSDGGELKSITTVDYGRGEWLHIASQFLPSGEDVLYSALNGSAVALYAVALNLKTGRQKVIIEGASQAFYVPPGFLVFSQNKSLMAAPLDISKFKPTGPSKEVLRGAMPAPHQGVIASFSKNGTLIYVPGVEEDTERMLVWVDRQGNSEPVLEDKGRYFGPRISPDGRKLAMWMDGQVWIYDFERGTLRPLTSEGQNFWPVWTPDGQRVAFPSIRAGSPEVNLFWKRVDGSAPSERLTQSQYVKQPFSWSPDGKTLLFHQSLHPSTGWDIWALKLDDNRASSPVLNSQFNERRPSLSPDGRWLAYESDESGRPEVYVTTFPNPGSRWLISSQGGTEPAWSRSSQELFYRNADRMMRVGFVTDPEFVSARPRLLFEGKYSSTLYGRNYDITDDGQRFIMVKSLTHESSATQINVVLNWFEELERLFSSEK